MREWNRIEIETRKTITSLIATAYSKKLLGELLKVSEKLEYSLDELCGKHVLEFGTRNGLRIPVK